MKARRDVAIAMVLLLVAYGVAPQEPRRTEIAFIGQFNLSHELSSRGAWFALVPAAEGMRLVQADVDVSGVPAECGDRNTKIVAPTTGDAILLVRGAASLQAGPVTTYFKGNRFIYPAEEFQIRLDSGLGAGFKAYGSAAPAEAETLVTNYELRMFRGGLTQTLATFRQLDWDGPPRLLWAGDLDRDGKLDALFNLQRHYASNSFALFLSSVAEGEQLVKRVAEFETTGC